MCVNLYVCMCTVCACEQMFIEGFDFFTISIIYSQNSIFNESEITYSGERSKKKYFLSKQNRSYAYALMYAPCTHQTQPKVNEHTKDLKARVKNKSTREKNYQSEMN